MPAEIKWKKAINIILASCHFRPKNQVSNKLAKIQLHVNWFRGSRLTLELKTYSQPAEIFIVRKQGKLVLATFYL